MSLSKATYVVVNIEVILNHNVHLDLASFLVLFEPVHPHQLLPLYPVPLQVQVVDPALFEYAGGYSHQLIERQV